MSGQGQKSPTELYWQAYIKFVTEMVGIGQAGSNDSRVVFISPAITPSVAASAFIPTAASNWELFNKVDVLLNPGASSAFYEPVASSSYFDSLLKYLMLVEIPESTTQGAKRRLEVAEEEMFAAFDKKEEEYEKAYTRWEEDQHPDKLPFTLWADVKAPRYRVALLKYNDKASRWESASNAASGGLQDQDLQKDKAKYLNIHNANDPGTDPAANRTVGCMPAYEMQVANLELLIDKAKTAESPQPVPEPTDKEVRWRPSYSIDPTYRSMMDQWPRAFGTTTSSTQQLTMDDGRGFSWHNYGHKDLSGSAGVNYVGLFRVGAQHGQSETWDKVKTDFNSSQMEITITWKAIRLFNVGPGIWDIPDIYDKYPHLKANPPTPNQRLIRPTQLLCASGFGAKVVFSDTARASMDEHITKVTSTSGGGGGFFGFLGFKAKVKGGSTSTTDTHEFTWKKDKGELVIEPTPSFGSSQLLAVVGQRLSPA